MRARSFDPKGFTLVELIIVVLVAAVLSVFVAQRLGNVTNLKAAAFVKKLRADLRFAQQVAMTRNTRVRVYFNGTGTAPASGYVVVADGSAGGDCSAFVAVSDPAGSGGLTIQLDAGSYAGISIAPVTTACLEYNSLGRPFDCSADLGICSTVAGGMSVAVKAGATTVGTVAVAAETGAVN